MAFLSRKSILLAILLHGQFIPYTQISLHPYIHFLTAQQSAYQSFLSYFLVGFCFHPSGMLGTFLDKNVCINMSNSYLTTMYESIFFQTIHISSRKIIFTIFAFMEDALTSSFGPCET